MTGRPSAARTIRLALVAIRLEVDGQQDHCFDQLCLHDGAFDDQDGLIGEDGGAFRYCPDIAGEFEIHELRRRANVYSVKPGITGWAQINGRDTLSVEEKVSLDAEYVEKSSLLFDLSILFRTVTVVFRKDGYQEGSRK